MEHLDQPIQEPEKKYSIFIFIFIGQWEIGWLLNPLQKMRWASCKNYKPVLNGWIQQLSCIAAL